MRPRSAAELLGLSPGMAAGKKGGGGVAEMYTPVREVIPQEIVPQETT